MKKVVISRRQFLRGSGGVALGLPFLPSLVPGKAWAQEVSFDPGPRFLMMCTGHGGVLESSMFPDESMMGESMTLYPGLDIRRGDLMRTVNGDRAQLSTVLSGSADVLTDQLVGKMNVLWGLDIPFYIAHHTGGHLGNFARNDGNGPDGRGIQQQHMPTIDQLMAWSPSFYTSLTGVTERALIVGGNGLSWGYSNPSAASGNIQEVAALRDAPNAFDRVFPAGPPTSEPTRPPIVDRVIEGYRSLRQGNRRLSGADRQRLDDHMDRLAELQRRLTTVNAACGDVTAPGFTQDPIERTRLLGEVVTAALTCGATRIAVMGVGEDQYVPFAGDWHQQVAHQWQLDGPQAQLVEANQAVFERVFLDLASRLDGIEEAPGQTVLDGTLMACTQESGEMTHEARSIPTVTFGSGGGFFRTGQFVDYRNRTDRGTRRNGQRVFGYTGLLYNQFLATCLQSMGVPQSEWQSIANNGATGYGVPLVNDQYSVTHVSGVVDGASDVLPFLQA